MARRPRIDIGETWMMRAMARYSWGEPLDFSLTPVLCPAGRSEEDVCVSKRW